MAKPYQPNPDNLIAIGPDEEGPPPAFVWRNGELVAWKDAQIHLHDFAFSAPSCVFEGIKAYRGRRGLTVFRLDDHIQRFLNSMKIFRMEPNLDGAAIADGVVETLKCNAFPGDAYIVPIAFWAGGGLGRAFSVPEPQRNVEIVIMAWSFASRLRTDVAMHCAVSSWRRTVDDVLPPRVKAVAHYQSMRLAFGEAQQSGYDSAIILRRNGKISEGIGACLFLRRGTEVITPDVNSDILEALTRSTAIELLRKEIGCTVVERAVDRSELYIAEEAFFAGTGVEIMPIVSVDRVTLGDGMPGAVTRELGKTYDAVVRGARPAYGGWLTVVDM